MAMTGDGSQRIEVILEANTKKLDSQLKQSENKFNEFGKNAVSSGKSVDTTFSKLGDSVNKVTDSLSSGIKSMIAGMVGFSAAMKAGEMLNEMVASAKEFNKAMLEVSTISSDVRANMAKYKEELLDMTTKIPIGATEAAKALYQINSAGQQGADAMHVLEVSAKLAIGGVTETSTAADAITTILNAYKMSANDAEAVSDKLFTTVKLGKTTMGELGGSISGVASTAATFGVSLDEVLGAIATMTKQGVPTSQAITQLNAGILAVSQSLGDGAFETRTMAEAFQEVADKAEGSTNALKEDVGRISALASILQTTGQNAEMAAQDLEAIKNSAGAATQAFEIMASSGGAQVTMLKNNILKAFKPIADIVSSTTGELAKTLNSMFQTGELQHYLGIIKDIVVAFGVYKGAVILCSVATKAWSVIQQEFAYQQALSNMAMKAAGQEVVVLTTKQKLAAVATSKLGGAFKALQRIIVTNPYTALAVAIGAVGLALYEVSKNADINAQKMHVLKEINEQVTEKVGAEVSEIERLNKILHDNSNSIDDRRSALNRLQEIVPTYLAQLDSEGNLINDNTDALHNHTLALIQDARAEAARAKIAEIAKKNFDLEFKRREVQQELDNTPEPKYDDPSGLSVSTAQSLQLTLQNLNREIEDNNKIISEIEATVKEPVKMDFLTADKTDRNKGGNNKNDNKNKPVVKNEAYWKGERENAEKEMKKYEAGTKEFNEWRRKYDEAGEKLAPYSEGYTKSQASKAKSAQSKADAQAKAAKKEAERLKSQEESEEKRKQREQDIKNKKARQEAEEEAERNQREFDLLTQYARERERMAIDLQFDIDQATIDQMKEGTKKTLAQLELDNRKKKEELKRQSEDILAQREEEERQLWETTNTDKLQTWLNTGRAQYVKDNGEFALTSIEEALKEIQETTADIILERGKEEVKKESESAMNEYLKAYGTMQEKRKAIADSYNRQIEDAQTEGEKMLLRKQLEEALKDFDFSQWQKDMNWEGIFSNLSNVSEEVINQYRTDLAKYMTSSEFKALSPDQKKTIVDAKKQLDEQYRQRTSIFKSLVNASDEFKMACQNYDEAVKALNDALGELDSANKSGDKEAIRKATENVEKARQGVRNAKGNRDSSQDNLETTTEDAIKNVSGVVTAIANLGTTSKITSESVGSLVSTIGNVLGKTGSKVAGIMGAAMTALQSLYDWMHKDYNKELYDEIDNLTGALSALKSSVDNLSEELNDSSITGSAEILLLQKQNIEEQTETIRKLMELNAQDKTSHVGDVDLDSANMYINEQAGVNWSAVSKAVGKSINSAQDFWKLTSKEMYNVSRYASSEYIKISEYASKGKVDVTDFMEEYIGQWKVLEELEDKYYEKVTSMTFDEVVSSFKSSLMNMSNSSEDFADNFEDMLRNAIINALVTDQYEASLKEWYKAFATDMSDGKITPTEKEALKKQYQSIVDKALATREQIAETMEWGDSEGSGSSKGFASMSQETGDRMEGRLTNIQINVQEILANVNNIAMSQQSLLRLQQDSSILQMETKSLISRSSEYLYNIEKYTSVLPSIKDEIQRIRERTDTL